MSYVAVTESRREYVRLETLGFANCWVWLIVVLLDAAARLVFTHEMLAFAGKIQPLK